MGAPLGNTNGRKSRMFEQALIREIKQRDLKDGEGETLRRIAQVLVDKAQAGDKDATREIADRLDGKPAQTVDVGNKDGEEFKTVSRIELVPLAGNANRED